MNLNVTWLFERPAGVDEDAFENWYLGQHAPLAKRLPGLRRYTVNRLARDADLETSPVFRVAQLVWDDAASASDAFNSPDGLATVGDGAVHAGLGYTWAMALTRDAALPVARPAVFDVIAGGFQGSADGTITKVLAYGTAAAPPEEYAADCAHLGEDPRLRQHVVGTGQGDVVRVGSMSFPAPGDSVCTWSVEWWFDDADDADAFLADAPARRAVQRLEQRSDRFFLGVFTSQELYRSVDALRPGQPLASVT